MDRLLQDLRYAARSLLGSPLVTAAAVTSLALGIGAVTAILGAVDHFLLRPLDYEDPEELVAVWTSDPERGWTSSSSSLPDVLDWREQSRTLELAAYDDVGMNLSGAERPQRLRGQQVTQGFFDVLREQPLLGRTFRPGEDRAGAHRVAVLSHGIWQRNFGGDRSVLGRVIELDGTGYEVIGVMPEDFEFGTGGQDLWIPFGVTGEENRGRRFLRAVGRLRGGATVEGARRELEAIQSRLAATYPDTNAGKGANVLSLRDEWFDEGFRQGSAIAGTAVLFVLLIACANVANLLLARGAARSREIALRSALGAGRARIVAQLLTESLSLAFAGGVLGIGIGYLGVEGIRNLFPPDMAGVGKLALDGRVLSVTVVTTVLAGLLFGLAPALQASRPDLKRTLSEGGRGSGGRGGGRIRRGLVAAEIALSTVLLISALLLVQGFVTVRSNDLGFRVADLATLRIALPEAEYEGHDEVVTFQNQLLDRMRGLPGVTEAAVGGSLPMTGTSSTSYRIVGRDPADEGRDPVASYRIVSPGFFEAFDIPLLAGRVFGPTDRAGAPVGVVVNELFARRHFGEDNPVGERIRVGDEHPIIGVVGDTRDWGPDSDPPPLIYFSALQNTVRNPYVVLRTSTEPAGLFTAVRDAVLSLDPDQPVYDLMTMEERIDQWMGGNLAMIKVLGALALIAFVLSAVGVYGVMAYSVAQRSREMGVRLALGAGAGSVRGLVVRQGLLLAGVGVLGGLAVASVTSRGLAFFLFGVSPYEPVPYVAVTTLLLLTALLASWSPAVRATRVDPVEVLSA